MDTLIREAPEIETRGLRQRCRDWDTEPWEFFGLMADYITGLLVDGRPVYLMAMVGNTAWTVVNRNVREQFTLFKVARREARKALKRFGYVEASMFKEGNEKKIQWTQRLGFKLVKETPAFVTLRME